MALHFSVLQTRRQPRFNGQSQALAGRRIIPHACRGTNSVSRRQGGLAPAVRVGLPQRGLGAAVMLTLIATGSCTQITAKAFPPPPTSVPGNHSLRVVIVAWVGVHAQYFPSKRHKRALSAAVEAVPGDYHCPMCSCLAPSSPSSLQWGRQIAPGAWAGEKSLTPKPRPKTPECCYRG